MTSSEMPLSYRIVDAVLASFHEVLIRQDGITTEQANYAHCVATDRVSEILARETITVVEPWRRS